MPAYNLARFDLLSLRLALGCARAGRLTVAARESHLALAAASRRLRELESALGQPLFVRSAQGLALTAAGHVFVRHATDTLASIDRLAVELGDLGQGVTRHVRLAASTAALNQFVPPLLARWAQAHPQVRIDVQEQVSSDVVAALHERRADIGIVVEGADVAGMLTRDFRRDELVVLLPPRHALARGRRALQFADLLDQEWIGLGSGAAVLQAQQQAAVAVGRNLRLRMQVRSFDAACQLVAAGLGLALLPRAAVQAMAQSLNLGLRPLAEPWAQRQLLLVRLNGLADGALQAVWDFFADSAVADAMPPTRAAARSGPGAGRP